MKGKGEPDIIISEALVKRLDLMPKFGEESNWVTLKESGTKFNTLDVKRPIRFWEDDPISESPQNFELSDEQRAKNLKKLAEMKVKLFTTDRLGYKPAWTNPYTGFKGTLTKEELRACQEEFFDMLFIDEDHEQRAWSEFLKYVRNDKLDPRGYDRLTVYIQTRQPNADDSFKQAQEVFNGS